MVEFNITVNKKQGTAYIPKELREALGYTLKCTPNSNAVVFYPANVDEIAVIQSLKLIIQHLRQKARINRSVK